MLGLLIPVWGRPELSERVLSWWAGPAFDWCYRVAVVSPEDPSPPRIPSAFRVVEHENVMQPKWQAGLDAMRDITDSVMMMGSDDLMTPGLARLLHVGALERGMAYPTSIYWAHPETKRLSHMKYGRVYAGCTYSMDMVERAGGTVFLGPAGVAPDVVSYGHVGKICHAVYAAPHCHTIGEAIVDIKTGSNVWSYDRMASVGRQRSRGLPCPEYDDFFREHFPDFVYCGEPTG